MHSAERRRRDELRGLPRLSQGGGNGGQRKLRAVILPAQVTQDEAARPGVR